MFNHKPGLMRQKLFVDFKQEMFPRSSFASHWKTNISCWFQTILLSDCVGESIDMMQTIPVATRPSVFTVIWCDIYDFRYIIIFSTILLLILVYSCLYAYLYIHIYVLHCLFVCMYNVYVCIGVYIYTLYTYIHNMTCAHILHMSMYIYIYHMTIRYSCIGRHMS